LLIVEEAATTADCEKMSTMYALAQFLHCIVIPDGQEIVFLAITHEIIRARLNVP
jgi:hypothetical protein